MTDDLDVAFPEYHRRIGEVITSNVRLETYLTYLAGIVLDGHVADGRKLGWALLDTHQWTKGKVEITDAIMCHFLRGEFLKRWKSILSDIKRLNHFRGDIAHSNLLLVYDQTEKTSRSALIKGGKNWKDKDAHIKIEKLDQELARYAKVTREIASLMSDLLEQFANGANS